MPITKANQIIDWQNCIYFSTTYISNMKRRIFFLAFFILVIIQFFHPQKNVSNTISANDITNHYTISPELLSVLKRSCYDCHSNNTSYPWYYSIQPVAWWMSHHINEGKGELNFSEFAEMNIGDKQRAFKHIYDEIKDDEMPLASYLLIHKDASLSESEKKMLMDWCLSQAITTH